MLIVFNRVLVVFSCVQQGVDCVEKGVDCVQQSVDCDAMCNKTMRCRSWLVVVQSEGAVRGGEEMQGFSSDATIRYDAPVRPEERSKFSDAKRVCRRE